MGGGAADFSVKCGINNCSKAYPPLKNVATILVPKLQRTCAQNRDDPKIKIWKNYFYNEEEEKLVRIYRILFLVDGGWAQGAGANKGF